MTALLEHVAHSARLDVVVDGHAQRTHMEQRVRRLLDQGKASEAERAQAEIDGPDAPDCLAYLLRWSDELYGRSGFTMDGLAPLTYTTIADWARLTGREPEPFEVEALLTLDATRRHPPEEDPNG